MKKYFTIIFFSLFVSMTFGQQTSVVIDAVANNGPLYYFHGKKVARTPSGLLMVVWVDRALTGGQINYSVYDNDFEVWSPAAAVSSAADRADKPAIAADELGNIHASWQERASSSAKYQIMYAKFDGISWSTPIKVSLQDTDNCEETSIEVDSRGYIWVVYNNDGAGAPNEFVWAVKSEDSGSTWSTIGEQLSSSGLIDGSITNGRCTLSAGADGKLVAIWHNGQPWDSARREISANQYDGTSWQGEVMISDTTTADRSANWYPTVALDLAGNIYAIYHTNDVSTDSIRARKMLVQKKEWDQTWDQSVTKVIDINYATDMLGTSAVADSNGIIHLIYQRDAEDSNSIDENVYTYSADQGNTWSAPLAMNRAGYDAGYATMSNRVRKAYGIDMVWRESYKPEVNDFDTTAVVYGNFPYDQLVSVSPNPVKPQSYDLISGYPNPFNPSIKLDYNISQSGPVSILIYDALGRIVRTLVNETKNSGGYASFWNGLNDSGHRMPSGVYIAVLRTGSTSSFFKMLMLK